MSGTELTPEDAERQRLHAEEQAEQARTAEQQRQEETVQRRSRLISIFSVECPHCSSSAGEICRSPAKKPQRTIHQARQKLAGVQTPEFRIEATSPYKRNVPEPALDSDLRVLLGDPLEDRTQEASARFELEQQHAAELRLHKARHGLWLATGGAAQAIEELPCERCGAEAGSHCNGPCGVPKHPHKERVRAAYEQLDPTPKLRQSLNAQTGTLRE
ncbi:hypothetical protein JHN49_13990 [Streptomyces sp. MBT57]|nr:hypothetical protein [Streptomyces sp. MBT57]